MSEMEWLNCADPEPMLEFLRRNCSLSERKLRLFAWGCSRHIWPLLMDERSRKAVEFGELYADGSISREMLWPIELAGRQAWRDARKRWAEAEATHGAQSEETRAAWRAVWAASVGMATPHGREYTHEDWCALPALAARAIDGEKYSAAWWRERQCQCTVLRDIFGNPFRPLPPRPEAIAPLAEQIYAGEWDKMPLLGEWLQEHGYRSEGEHCLDPNIKHVKGCWVVDWVTGRE